MRQRSDIWKRIAARGDFGVESVAIIGGVEYTAISAPDINRALFSDNLSVGNCISSTLKLSVLTDDEIAKSAKVEIKSRIYDDVEHSEWLEFGTFYIDTRTVNNGLVTLLCYDKMLRANQMYGDETNPEDRIGWPKTMQTCVEEVATRIGVEIDPRTVIKTTAPYQVPYPHKLTMMQVLGYIGACHGGNWMITPENKLRLVPLVSSPVETFNIIDNDYNPIYTGDGHKLVWRHTETGDTVEHKAGGGMLNVPVVVGKIETSKNRIITRVTLARDEDLGYTLGNDTGYELRIESNPYACQAICDDLYADLKGMEYLPYAAQSACYDPAAELGDWVIIGDKVRSVLYSESAKFNIDFRANISAPGKDESNSEYPYLTAIEQLKKKDEQLEKYLEESKTIINSKIEQTHTEILIEVSGTYATKDYVSSSIKLTDNAIAAEVLRATTAEEEIASRVKLTEDKITAEVSRSTKADTEMSSSLSIALEKIELKVSKGDISSQISLETGKVTIGSNRLVIDSENFKLSGTGKVTATGSITSENGSYKTTVSGGGVKLYYDDMQVVSLLGNGLAGSNYSGVLFGEVAPVAKLTIDMNALIVSNGSTYFFAFNDGLNVNGCDDRVWLGGSMHIDRELRINDEYGIEFVRYDNDYHTSINAVLTDLGYGVKVEGDLIASGRMWCDGEKYRVVSTENYGRRGLSAMESTVPVFSDIGSGVTDENGDCYVFFDPVFAETIDLQHDYQVFVSIISGESVPYTVDKASDYFVIHAQPSVVFDWMAFARQKDYANNRLETVDTYPVEKTSGDDSVFYGDDTGANASMSYMDEFPDTYDEQAEAYLKEYELEVTNYGN